ncbi:MAG: mechanosensitive ion channel family protein [Nanoarchaeota archaeon]|nr:mechanosensitive ion channel family protein [Nanoarchaeota archaeon]MBU1854446.1 mechanosensitive ion channel family protein [Nanoarchaeota archaeon]
MLLGKERVVMKVRNHGFVLAAILLAFFTVYSFREEFYNSILANYNVISDSMTSWVPKIVTIVIIILFAKFVSSFFDSLLQRYFKYVGKEKEYFSVNSIISYVIWLLAILGILSVMIGNVGVWLTSVGLIGFGITFALQKPILNFVGWLTIIFSKTYTIGDRISVGGEKGDVLEIQMMYTVMDGLLENTDELSGKIVTIPNEQVLTSSVVNFTKSGEYLWDALSVDVTYESDWNNASEILKDVTFKVVHKYVKQTMGDTSEQHKNILDNLNILKKLHKETVSHSEKKVIEKHLDEAQVEKNKLEDMRMIAFKDIKKEPEVRVELRGSSIGLTVRYVAHYRNLRRMKSEIYSSFLASVAKTKKVEIAYPHLQIVQR